MREWPPHPQIRNPHNRRDLAIEIYDKIIPSIILVRVQIVVQELCLLSTLFLFYEEMNLSYVFIKVEEDDKKVNAEALSCFMNFLGIHTSKSFLLCNENILNDREE